MTHTAKQKYKNRRKTHLALRLLRLYFRYVGPVFPRLVGAWAYKLWFATRRHPTPKREQGWIATATEQTLDIDGLPVHCYHWASADNNPDAPLVLLAHGWDGRGSQMGAFAEPLQQAGFRVLAYDNPAHGKTPGKASSLFIHSEVQQALVKKVGPVHAIICHSFGGMFTTYSLSQGMQTDKVVSISAPSDFMFLLNRFCNVLHMPEVIRQDIIRRFTQEFGEDLVERVSPTQTSRNLGAIPALIIHDEDDRDVPLSEAHNFHAAWPGSTLKTTQGLGHRRVLYYFDVIESAVSFIKDKK